MTRSNSDATTDDQIPIVVVYLKRTCEHRNALMSGANGKDMIAKVLTLHRLHRGSLPVRIVDLKCD